MSSMNVKHAAAGAMITILLGAGSTAQAQSPGGRWSVEVGIGWDNGISGNINSSESGDQQPDRGRHQELVPTMSTGPASMSGSAAATCSATTPR